MPFFKSRASTIRRRPATKSRAKKVTFKRKTTRRKSNPLSTAVRGVTGSVYNSYSKPRTSGRKVRRIVSREINAIKATGNPLHYPILYGNQQASTANGVAHLQVIAQAYDGYDLQNLLANMAYISPASTAVQVSGLTSVAVRKFVTDNFRGAYVLKNNTNVDLEMDLYWCIARRDLDINAVPTGAFGNGVNYADIAQTMLDGYYEQTNATAVSKITWPLGVTPFQITRFCEFYKILKSKRVLLGGGRNTTIKMNDKKMLKWTSDMIFGRSGSNNLQFSCFANRTISILAITRGGVVNDGTTKSLISTYKVQYNLLGEESYTAYNSPAQPSYIGVATPLSAVTVTNVALQETEVVMGVAST